MTYEEILKQLEEYRAALASEDRLARAGLKARPAFVSVRERYDELFSQETIVALREMIERTPQPKKRDQMERTLFALLEGVIAAETLPIEEKIFSKAAALETGADGLKIPYAHIAGVIAREEDGEKRETLRQAQAALAEELAPLRIDLEHASRQAFAKFGFGTVREYSETKKRLRYDAFLQKTIPLLQETTGMYRRVMSDTLRRAYGKELGDIGSAHVLHWRAGNEFAHLFPPEKLISLCSGAFTTIGLPFEQAPQIRIDAETRPGKHPRSGCFAPRPPEEVYVLLKPQGGYGDIRDLLHQGGHAFHFAYTDASLPYEWRGLPRSRALTETFAALVERLPENPLWLEHVMRVPKAASERFGAWALLDNLFMLRRHVAQFSYELAFDEKPYDAGRNKELYAKTLHDLTGFAYEPEFWLEDMDGGLGSRSGAGFCSADKLRAWIAAAQLEEHLVRTFSDRWFLKRDTGAFLKELFAKGVSWDAEELVQSLGMTAWDPLPLIRKFDGISRLLR